VGSGSDALAAAGASGRQAVTAAPAALPVTGRLALRDVPMILMYHAVADVVFDPHLMCVPPERFAQQMSWLAGRGLRGVSVGTLIKAMRAGHSRGLVGITFDDGYASVLEAALPVLCRYGFGATVFVITDQLGGSNDWDGVPDWPLLSAAGIRELASAGIEIGSHSASHVLLTGLAPGQLARQVSQSRADLAEVLGGQVAGFAYPFGVMDAGAQQAVHDAGYSYACAVQAPVHALSYLALPRIYAGPRDTAARMTAKRHLYRGYIAYRGRHR
jgi:peptidoglycan/xylan/chitin deacetylase (PgdA/CDA1 family)